jgi:hypothetical protein
MAAAVASKIDERSRRRKANRKRTPDSPKEARAEKEADV